MGSDPAGTIQNELPNTTAYLLERRITEHPIGNRTSMLFYNPDSSFTGNITIICDEGRGNIVCNKTILIIGGESLAWINNTNFDLKSSPF